MNDATQTGSDAKVIPPSKRWRWFTFRLSTLFVAITVMAIVFAWPRIWREIQLWRFKSYVGKDIRKLPEAEQLAFRQIVKSLLNKPREELLWFGPEDWFVWRVNSDLGPRLMLFQGRPLFMIPGQSSADVHLFTESGVLMGTTHLATGWRINIENAELLTDQLPGEYVIRVDTSTEINGADITKQYYALLADKVALIRMENSQGEMVANWYGAPNHTIGQEIDVNEDSDFVAALGHQRATEVLRSLVWLGGSHGKPNRNPGNVSVEEYEQAALHERLIRQAATRRAVDKLIEHSNRWIAEAARQAKQVIEATRAE